MSFRNSKNRRVQIFPNSIPCEQQFCLRLHLPSSCRQLKCSQKTDKLNESSSTCHLILSERTYIMNFGRLTAQWGQSWLLSKAWRCKLRNGCTCQGWSSTSRLCQLNLAGTQLCCCHRNSKCYLLKEAELGWSLGRRCTFMTSRIGKYGIIHNVL